MSNWDKPSQRALAFIEFNDVELEDIFKFLNKCYEVTPAREIKADINAELKHRRSKLEHKLTSEPAKPINPEITFVTPGRLAACIDILDLYDPAISVGAARNQLLAEDQRRTDEKAAELVARTISGDILTALGALGNAAAISGGLRTDIATQLAKMGYKK